MKLDSKTGLLICNVCGHEWNSHGVGGNCTQPPVQKEDEKNV